MDPDWWASIESLMRAHPGVAERLIVEITETVAIQDIDDLRGFVTRLKNFGSRIAIDDFGAGYTSFRNSAQARRRYREDRRRVRAKHRSLGRRSRLRADADRSGAPAGNQDGRGMGSGRGVGGDAARLGLRLHPGPPDRARIFATALGDAGPGRRCRRRADPARHLRSRQSRDDRRQDRVPLTLPFSALSTCARGVPACPSSDGAGRRCCLLPAPVQVFFRLGCGGGRSGCAAARTA